MIIVDFETNGLITNEALPLSQQPSIIEIGLLKCADAPGLPIINQYSAFVLPPVLPLPEIITKITGICDEDLLGAAPFVAHLAQMRALFLGEFTFCAHNAPFDHGMLVLELRRLGKEFRFPWPPEMLDTLTLYPHKLARWAKEVKGPDWKQTHRALEDVLLLRDCLLTVWPKKNAEDLHPSASSNVAVDSTTTAPVPSS